MNRSDTGLPSSTNPLWTVQRGVLTDIWVEIDHLQQVTLSRFKAQMNSFLIDRVDSSILSVLEWDSCVGNRLKKVSSGGTFGCQMNDRNSPKIHIFEPVQSSNAIFIYRGRFECNYVGLWSEFGKSKIGSKKVSAGVTFGFPWMTLTHPKLVSLGQFKGLMQYSFTEGVKKQLYLVLEQVLSVEYWLKRGEYYWQFWLSHERS